MSNMSNLDNGESKTVTPTEVPYAPTSDQVFPGFSFIGDDGRINSANVLPEQKQIVRHYLSEHHNAEKVSFSSPFVIVGCQGDPPPESERPFTVAGMVALWRRSDEMELAPIVGKRGSGRELEIEINQTESFQFQRIPQPRVILSLANTNFTECVGISYLWQTLVIEMPPMTQEDFLRRLKTLPSGIKGAEVLLRFHNGPLVGTEMAQHTIVPDTPTINDRDDNTDYVSARGSFYPGTMIGSLTKRKRLSECANTGMLIRRGSEERLMCAFHCWANHVEKHPDALGNTDGKAQKVFAVQQGANPGSNIGFLRERVENTSIGLVQLRPGVTFKNVFMESPYRPKRMVRAVKQHLGDRYVFNSFCTGWRALMGYGYRWSIGRKVSDLEERAFLESGQGIYVSNKPVDEAAPLHREKVGGSLLLKIKDATRKHQDTDTVIQRGDIAGMMCRVDAKSPTSASLSGYLYYADTFDDLLEDGWEVAGSGEGDDELLPYWRLSGDFGT